MTGTTVDETIGWKAFLPRICAILCLNCLEHHTAETTTRHPKRPENTSDHTGMQLAAVRSGSTLDKPEAVIGSRTTV